MIGHRGRRIVRVGRVEVDEARRHRLERELPGRPAARGEGVTRAAVVPAVVRQDLVASRLPALPVVLPGELHGRFGGLGATRQELHRGVRRRCELEDAIDQLQGRRGRGHRRRPERELAELCRHGVDDLGVAMAQAGREDARQAVDVGTPARIGHPDTVAAIQHERIVNERLHLVEVHHQVAGEGHWVRLKDDQVSP